MSERNICYMQSMSRSQAKIKISSSLANNLYGNKNTDKKVKNENKKRPKSNNYRKPKMDAYNINKHSNNFKKNLINKTKNLNILESNYLFNFKRPKSSNVKIKKNINNMMSKPINNAHNKENKLLTLEETQQLCDKMIKKMKYTLELVKAATIGE